MSANASLSEVAERAIGGDLDAFSELVRRRQDLAFGYALALVGDFHQAEDVVQEAFIAAHRGL